jgi:hypothetical protein
MEARKHPILRALDGLLNVVSPLFRFIFPSLSPEPQKHVQGAGPDARSRAWGERDQLIAALADEVASNRVQIRMLKARHEALLRAFTGLRAQVLDARWDPDTGAVDLPPGSTSAIASACLRPGSGGYRCLSR